MRRSVLPIVALVAATGCGGGGSARQDADEPRRTYSVDVLEARFPSAQRVSQQEEMRIRVRNEDEQPIPNLVVTVTSFSQREQDTGLADPNRPIWIVDRSPVGGETAYVNTWALGRVPAGAEREFTWRVTPTRAGTFSVRYRVEAGLDGRARARLQGGDVAAGEFRVQVSDRPSDARVDPDTGAVIRD